MLVKVSWQELQLQFHHCARLFVEIKKFYIKLSAVSYITSHRASETYQGIRQYAQVASFPKVIQHFVLNPLSCKDGSYLGIRNSCPFVTRNVSVSLSRTVPQKVLLLARNCNIEIQTTFIKAATLAQQLENAKGIFPAVVEKLFQLLSECFQKRFGSIHWSCNFTISTILNLRFLLTKGTANHTLCFLPISGYEKPIVFFFYYLYKM